MTFYSIGRYWIATDLNCNAVQAIGKTKDEAIETMIADAGPFRDDEGNEVHGDEARDFCIAFPCTEALYEQVLSTGGDISWSIRDGVACTDEEAYA